MTIAHALIQEVLEHMRGGPWSDHDLFGVELALEEALANAVHHGNEDDEAKNVHFSCTLSDNLIRVQVEDEGPGFDPHALRDPRAPENIENISGRGVLLIYGFMTRVEFNPKGNLIKMEKDLERK